MNTKFLDIVTNFIKKRTFELMGLSLILLSIALTISFITYTPNDPSIVYGSNASTIKNFFGIYGSITSDFLLQSFGLVSFLLIATFMSWGLKLLIKKELKKFIFKFLFVVLYLIFGCTLVYITFNNSFWLIDNGNSGFVGEMSYALIYKYFPLIENIYSNYILIFFTLTFF